MTFEGWSWYKPGQRAQLLDVALVMIALRLEDYAHLPEFGNDVTDRLRSETDYRTDIFAAEEGALVLNSGQIEKQARHPSPGATCREGRQPLVRF